MTRFWSAAAIVSAVWAAAGHVDEGSVVGAAVALWCLRRLWVAARAEDARC